ncbi:hypothetical protein AB0E59_41220 [Lentzea sp. NPDC034063]|uniref:hypothetical protein n=1 Tax=unclassified Lentzea TaxID=2643253 RepID=UPI0033E0B3DE
MTDLDALRRAMQTPPVEGFGELDLDAIMATGGRIRRRRRLLVGGGVVTMTAVLLVGVSLVGQQLHRGPDVGQSASTMVTTAPTSLPEPDGKPPLGDLIPTGVHNKLGELTLYFYAIDDSTMPNVRFGISAVQRTPSGDVVPVTSSSDFVNSDRPGSHFIRGGLYSHNGSVFIPAFGYYVGPADRIEAEIDGTTVRAQMVPWSHDSSVKAFWFPQELISNANLMSSPSAFDAQGNRLTP